MLDTRREVVLSGVDVASTKASQIYCIDPCPKDGFAEDGDNDCCSVHMRFTPRLCAGLR
jgi:hypothetical protein